MPSDSTLLRPRERRVRAMAAAGCSHDEIGRRLRCSSDHVARMLEWTEIPRPTGVAHRFPRAVEARIAALRAAGESDDAIARRFRREPGFVDRIALLSGYRAGRR